MQLFGRFLSRITLVMTFIGGLAIALMMLNVVLDVAGRYLFATPVPGTITVVSYYYMIIAAFVPLAFAEQKNAHISVEVVTERLPGWLQRHLNTFSLLLSTVVFLLLAVRTWGEAVSKQDIGASVVQGVNSIVIWPTYYVLPVGFALMALVLVHKFLASLFWVHSGLDEHRARPDDPAEFIE